MAEYLAENSQLRQLSRRYAEGALPAEDYRAARRELLQNLLDGKVQTYREAPARKEPSVGVSSNPEVLRHPDDSVVFYKTMPPGVLSANPEHTEAAPHASTQEPAQSEHSVRTLAMVIGGLLALALGALLVVFVI